MANLTGLNPDLADALAKAKKELAAQGITLSVTSGKRTVEEQAALRQQKGSLAARPGPAAPHVAGNALDLSASVGIQHPAVVAALKKQGLYAPVKGEPWHWEVSPSVFISERKPDGLDQFFADFKGQSAPKKPDGLDRFFTDFKSKPAAAPQGDQLDAFLTQARQQPAPQAKPYRPNPNIPRDQRTGRVIDPTTGLPFQRPMLKIGGFHAQVEAPGTPFSTGATSLPAAAQAGGAGDVAAQGAQRLINTLGSTLYPVRDLFNKEAEEKAKLAKKYGGYDKIPKDASVQAFMRGLKRWAPWESFKQGVLQGKATDFQFFQKLAEGDPKFKQRLKAVGGPEMADFLASFAVDIPSGMAQGAVVEGLSKGAKALKVGERVTKAAEHLPQTGPLGYLRGEIVNRPAYGQAATAFKGAHARAEALPRELSDIAQEEKLLTQQNAKRGATVRVKNPITNTHHNAFSEQVADYMEAGAKGSKYESPAATLEPILARARGAKVPQKLVAAEQQGAARAQALQQSLQQAGRTKGQAAVQALTEGPRAVEAQIVQAARTKGAARVGELVRQGEQSHAAMLSRGRQAVRGLLNEADMQAAADAAALSQYNEFTNALGQAKLPEGDLAELLGNMKQAGRDAVARAVERGESAREAARAAAQAAREAAQARHQSILARAGTQGRARVQQLLQSGQEADAAESRAQAAAQAVLDRAVQGGATRGRAAVQEGLAQANAALAQATTEGGAAGAQRVSDLLQGTAPSERQAPIWEDRALMEARRSEELPKVKAATEALGINYEDVERIGERYKSLADRVGQQLVDLKLLSPTAYEGLRGYYLPRLYMLKASRPAEAKVLLRGLEERGLIEPEAARVLESELTPTGRFGLTPRRGGQDFTKARDIESFSERISPEAGRVAAPTATAPMSRYIASATREIGDAEAIRALQGEAGLARPSKGATEPPPRDWVRIPFQGEEYDVHPGVARYLQVRAQALKQPETALGEGWSAVNKALRRWWISSPRTAVNNAAGNIVLAQSAKEVNGIHQSLPESVYRWTQDWKTFRDFRQGKAVKDPYIQEAADSGVISEGAGIIPQEAKKLTGSFGVETPLERLKQAPGELLQFKHPAQEAYSQAAYGDVEKATRFHLFKELRKSGKSVEEAARITEAAMIDYSDIGPLLRWAERNNISPFLTFPAKAFFQYANLAARRPDMFQTFTGERFRDLADRLADRIAAERGMKGGNKEKRLKGQVRLTDFPIPGAFDESGTQRYLRAPLASPILQMGPNDPSGGIANFGLERLKTAFPLPRLAIELATNQNTFTGQPIVAPGTTPGSLGRPEDILHDPQVAKAYAMHVGRAFLPQVTDVERLYHGFTGTTPFMSRNAAKQSLAGALLQAFTGASLPEGAADSSIDRLLRGAGRLKAGKEDWAAFSRDYRQKIRSGQVPLRQQYVDYLQQFHRSGDLSSQFSELQKRLPDAIFTESTTGKDHEQLIKNYWDWFEALRQRYKELRQQEAAGSLLR